MSRLLVLLCFLCSNAYVHAEVILRRDTLGSIQGEIQSAGKTGLLLITSENQNKMRDIVKGIHELCKPDNITINLVRGDPKKKVNGAHRSAKSKVSGERRTPKLK